MDYQTLLRDLLATGLTQREIGLRIGLTQSAVAELASGRSRSPRGDAVLYLVELARERGISAALAEQPA